MADVLNLVQLDDLVEPGITNNEAALGTDLGNLGLENVQVDRDVGDAREDVLDEAEQ
jgi:hypothetical protein